ncbi:CD1871A family CXXC motif-containing protein [Treponema berlinense]|uniref:Thioredoxin n=1 Tax=Treponema berlinense TaxID=225004 RepID=A0A1T4KTQ6_9SPIR|nr:CD1871A family CXXC motif-containing protein [Treponema berlinense]SJZ45805.1 hypothetical protein SAMN02745152_00308 [Treponema berlinense]
MKKYTPFFLFIIGILLVVFGIVTEENETVFEKATRICLECIGIG